jgi:hypothetical protein
MEPASCLGCTPVGSGQPGGITCSCGLDQLARAAELERKAKTQVYRGALEAIAAGCSEVAVAAAIGRVPATVSRWVSRATMCPDCSGFGHIPISGGCERCDNTGHLPLADVLTQLAPAHTKDQGEEGRG